MALTPAEQQHAQTAAEAAAFAARRKTPAKTAMTSAFSLAEKSAQIKASRAVITGSVKVIEGGRISISDALDAAGVGSLVAAELARHTAAASANNLAGKPRYVKSVRIEIEVEVR